MSQVAEMTPFALPHVEQAKPLFTELSTIFHSRKTGRMFAFRESNEFGVRSRPAEADFYAGEIINFSFSGEQGMGALENFICESIDRVMFVETDGVKRGQGQALMSTADLLANYDRLMRGV